MKNISLSIILGLLVFVGGCAHDAAQKKSPELLFQEAAKQAAKGRVERSSELFMQLRTFYPGHELARASLLAMGDLYFDNEEYPSALSSYQEFLMLYPTDVKADYVLYRIGMSHFKQMASHDRDQTETRQAIQAFNGLIARYPASPYSTEADANIAQARVVIAENILYIGRFYLKKKNLEAACQRFQEARRDYSGIGLDDEIDALITKACGGQDR